MSFLQEEVFRVITLFLTIVMEIYAGRNMSQTEVNIFDELKGNNGENIQFVW